MEQHGKRLAQAHRLSARRSEDRLLPRLADNEVLLLDACQLLTAAVRAERRITPAGEWLLDNFYLIEEQIRTAKRHLPPDYSRQLPCLDTGASAGLPRVYDIALETIAHGDGRVDPESLSRFVAAYQTVTPIMLGELWAIPIMLRLALIENLRRVGADVAAGRIDRDLADGWADQMVAVAQADPKSLVLVIADMARSNPPMTMAFVAELSRRLRGHGSALALPLTWIEQRLTESNLTIEQLVQASTQQQAANQVSVSNSIGSLRFLGAMDWRTFVESMSVVEHTLRQDPAGTYAYMDFVTRDRYRHVIEKLARDVSKPEVAVAEAAIAMAREADGGADGRIDARRHVGYYLIDAGRPRLERAIGVRRTGAAAWLRWLACAPTALYLGAIGTITLLLTAAMMSVAMASPLSPLVAALTLIVVLIATSQLAVALANWLVDTLVSPVPLPRLDLEAGIPASLRTLVAVPAMLTSSAGINALVEALEVRYLANRDNNLRFALLTDFVDAAAATTPTDAPLLRLAQQCIGALNAKYRVAAGSSDASSTGSEPFYLLHRPRLWNPGERVWMGYERKRGKLGALNALLRGEAGASALFSCIVGDPVALSGTKYVITLDSDTELPRDAARQLVGAMAHPLNRPYFDPIERRVTAGYGILQPRMVTSLPSSNRSTFAQAFGGEPGIDPYTRAVSDVYQDAFDEGSFIGKGIYDVDAFEQALNGRFPENRILSHDLLEGAYVRSGLITDVQLYDIYPAHYSTDVSRRRRWIRGDWQIAGWLLRTVPGPDGSRERNPLSWLSQWKIFDNLRRSVVSPAMLVLLVLAWTVLAPAWWWTVIVVGIAVVPVLMATLLDVLRKPTEVSLRQHLAFTARSAARGGLQLLFSLACLPYEAYFSVAAILTTHSRMLIARHKRLEWTPSSELAPRDRASLQASVRAMWFAPAFALVVAITLVRVHAAALPVAAPLLLLWFVAPAFAWWMSRLARPRPVVLTVDQRRFLRTLARQTWGYFETFVSAADNWLPPDNFQVVPTGTIAHRTSPTNMGMALLADLAAYDFGYLPAGRLLERCQNTLQSMRGLERSFGHFYNWYDTQSGKPLPQRYISTVDSGNLAGHLLTLRAGLLALPDDLIIDWRVITGVADTLHVLRNAHGAAAPAAFVHLQREMAAASTAPPPSLAAMAAAWRHLDVLLIAAVTELRTTTPTDANDAAAAEIAHWTGALEAQWQSIGNEWVEPFKWLDGGASDVARVGVTAHDRVPTWRALAALEAGPASGVARARLATIDTLAAQCDALARMDFRLLYDKARHLFVVGYNVDDRQRDVGYYDLLASEARLATFIAIAEGQVPQESWFALGRQLMHSAGGPVLLSWSGSMFEYLMPLMVMPAYENTLLETTGTAAVERQIAYGKQLGLPWGISESGYNAVDAALNYQYRAFGVPGLGLKRGLAADAVVAPYASALALMVAPEAACANLQRLAGDGLAGRFGLYEAIDYTAARLPRGQSSAVVRSFMAHHQGMSLVALDHLLLDRPMQKRFETDPVFQATLLLLQERVPNAVAFLPYVTQITEIRENPDATASSVRIIGTATTTVPEVQLLSNGSYHVMVTNAGGGSSRWQDLAVTRWHEDATCDQWGTYCYVRDVISGEFWSVAHQPTGKVADHYEAIFCEGRAEFRRRDHGIELHTEITVSPEDDIELRRMRVINRSRAKRTLEFTSYAEIVLAPAAQDASHPAFSNLFVQTEILPDANAIIATRRSRSPGERVPWMFGLLAVQGATATEVSYETDRMRFIGRGRTPTAPLAMVDAVPLSGSAGAVLDPILSIRVRVLLDPGQSVTIDQVLGAAASRETVLALVAKYKDPRLADRVVELAWTHAQVILRQINASETDARLYARLANSIVFANAALRADPSIIARNRRGQSDLWGYAISGDLPIVLLRMSDAANMDLVRQMVQAHGYWRLKGLAVDLVIWNEDHGGYRQLLQDQILELIDARNQGSLMNRPGGIFVRRGDQISDEDRTLLESVARVIVADGRGTLAEQIDGRALVATRPPRLVPTVSRTRDRVPDLLLPRPLILGNGLGGFAPDGTEYVITTDGDRLTPAPWVNVLANPQFGTILSESGGAYTWSENAHEFRLTPWSNDPVSDASGEAIYIRDEESGAFWSPTPLPARGVGAYVTRHGFGYTVFEHEEDGIHSELWVFVAADAAVKFSWLRLRNGSGRSRRLTVTGYVEWVLGDLRPKSLLHVVTAIDNTTGAVYARNSYSTEFSERVGFFDVDALARTFTCDRTEFIGRNGSLAAPAAMKRVGLSGKSGPALDPCTAFNVLVVLAADEAQDVTFRLGAGRRADDAKALAHRFRGAAATRQALEVVRSQWRHALGAVTVRTTDPSLNVLCNGWLVYQTMACRLWARSGFYQSGGAFGFRDQLQDVLALVHTEPGLTRAHILLCASRQFVEGDVQHWWHPPAGRGVRTRCSDDYLWLPLAIARYVRITGDTGILDEHVSFLDGRQVNAGEDSYYDLPERSVVVAPLYDHATRAILHGLRFGAHGLPLMGSGDWNDGMNLVGIEGKGESVWLAFFLGHVLNEFAPVARARGDATFAERCMAEASALFGRVETGAWDGGWYRRAYFDDGTPLGSAANDECRIDSISQSWAVLSSGGEPTRARTAMDAVYTNLVRRDDAIIQLLTPPFDQSAHHPGYIRGYVPGVRENGGQYTHGAIWTVMAFAALGDAHRAWELMDMINPINHGRTAHGAEIYRVEPYVVSADVYAMAPYIGRGGWSWYTGSAGWMYRLLVESLLGLDRRVDTLRLAPCLPAHWREFTIDYRFHETTFHITVEQSSSSEGATTVWVDGELQADAVIPLRDDRVPHDVRVQVPAMELVQPNA